MPSTPHSFFCRDEFEPALPRHGTLFHWADIEGPSTELWALYCSALLNVRVAAFLDFLMSAFPKGTPDELAAYIEA